MTSTSTSKLKDIYNITLAEDIENIIEQGAAFWAADKKTLDYEPDSKLTQHESRKRDDDPGHCQFSTSLISLFFEKVGTIIMTASMFKDILKVPLKFVNSQAFEKAFLQETEILLKKYKVNKTGGNHRLNLDSFNNILMILTVKYSGNGNLNTLSKKEYKNMFACNIQPHQLYKALISKTYKNSIHMNILITLHEISNFVSEQDLTDYTAKSTRLLGLIGTAISQSATFQQHVELRGSNYISFKKSWSQIPADIKSVFLLQLGDYDQAKNYYGDYKEQCDENDVKKILGVLYFNFMWLNWKGEFGRTSKGLHFEVLKHREGEEKTIREEMNDYFQNAYKFMILNKSVMCQSFGCDIEIQYNRTGDVGHRKCNSKIILYKNPGITNINDFLNNIALVDSAIEEGRVNQWHSDSYVLFWGSRLWGSWQTRENSQEQQVNKCIEDIQTILKQEYVEQQIKRWKYHLDKITEFAPYNLLLEAYVDKMMKVIAKYDDFQFNRVGRDNGIKSILCCRCANLIHFHEVNETNKILIFDLFTTLPPPADKATTTNRMWFLPFLGFAHDSCPNENVTQNAQKDFIKKCMTKYWAIFTTKKSEIHSIIGPTEYPYLNYFIESSYSEPLKINTYAFEKKKKESKEYYNKYNKITIETNRTTIKTLRAEIAKQQGNSSSSKRQRSQNFGA